LSDNIRRHEGDIVMTTMIDAGLVAEHNAKAASKPGGRLCALGGMLRAAAWTSKS
jgi:hypothetical protein